MTKEYIAKDSKFVTETLPEIIHSIELIISDSEPQRSPVDCVAYGYSVLPVCFHPDRGKQYGCLLVEQNEDGTNVRRIKGATCDFRVKEGAKGATELRQRIAFQEEPKL